MCTDLIPTLTHTNRRVFSSKNDVLYVHLLTIFIFDRLRWRILRGDCSDVAESWQPHLNLDHSEIQ